MPLEYLRRAPLAAGALLLAATSVSAQARPAVNEPADRRPASRPFCYAPRPSRLCGGFLMLEAGAGRFITGTHGHYSGGDRRDFDQLWGVGVGVMRNVSPATSWGAIVLASSAPDGFEVRYRRWLDTSSAALDLGLGLAFGRRMYMVPDERPALGLTGSATLWGNRALGIFARGLVVQDDSAHVSTGLWLGVQTGSSLALVLGPIGYLVATGTKGW